MSAVVKIKKNYTKTLNLSQIRDNELQFMTTPFF